jgi:translocation and assembly module TamB
LDVPLAGVLDFTAAGSGSFDAPRFEVRGTLRDLFVADEGIGQIVGDINVNGELMTLRIEAASSRLAVSVAGRIALTPERDADISLTVADTSLDPYVRVFLPRLSPFTTAVASGSIRVVGELNDIDHLNVDVTVDQLDMRLFDYALRNARPIRLALDRHVVRITDMRLVGQDTQLDVAGVANLHDETVSVRTNGDANLAVLQGFVPNVRSTGMANLAATLEGPLEDPIINGTFAINDGRVRHFSLPHALENVNGAMRFDSKGVTLDGLTGRLGGGEVRFGGRIDKQGYLPGRLDVTMSGRDMRLRFPEGMRSLVDADLALQGTVESATLSGQVTVNDAIYTQAFNAGGDLFAFGSDSSLVPAAAPQQTLPVRLDIQINAPGTLQVQNRAVRLVANADLQVRGTVDRPLVFGRVELERGEALFEGKRYIVTRGTVDFNNPARIEPFIDVEAETRVRVPGETYRVTLRATGTPARLNTEFSSDPPLPEVEVLALVFSDVAPGGNAELRQFSTDITPQQQLLRDRLARGLTGRVSSEVDRVVAEAFRVDTFLITPTFSEPNPQSSSRLEGATARVTVGKRLSNRVFLTYTRSLSSATRDQIILLEYDQTDRFSWILSRNEDGTYALDWRVRRTF